MIRRSLTKLNRPLHRMIVPDQGRPFVVTLRPSGEIWVRPRYGRKGSERLVDLREFLEDQLQLKIKSE